MTLVDDIKKLIEENGFTFEVLAKDFRHPDFEGNVFKYAGFDDEGEMVLWGNDLQDFHRQIVELEFDKYVEEESQRELDDWNKDTDD